LALEKWPNPKQKENFMKKLIFSLIIIMFGFGIAYADKGRTQSCAQDCSTKLNNCMKGCEQSKGNAAHYQGCKNICSQVNTNCNSSCARK